MKNFKKLFLLCVMVGFSSGASASVERQLTSLLGSDSLLGTLQESFPDVFNKKNSVSKIGVVLLVSGAVGTLLCTPVAVCLSIVPLGKTLVAGLGFYWGASTGATIGLKNSDEVITASLAHVLTVMLHQVREVVTTCSDKLAEIGRNATSRRKNVRV